jgi:site-specific recombinase XerD
MEQSGRGQDVHEEDDMTGGGALVELHVTELARGAGTPGVDAAAVLARAGVRAGQVFVLGSDGGYDVKLNRFLRELEGWGVRAASSVAAYGRDVMLFCRFLDQGRGGKPIWECDTEDLAAFKRARLHGGGGAVVSVSTWRRSIAALDKWAVWALAERVIETEPFRYRDKTVLTPRGPARIRVNACSEPDPGPAPVEFICFEDYLLWRDVGLRGFLPSGIRDPSWRGRHGERNALFADLLIYTGMRLGEASALLACELPGERAASGARIGAIRIGPAVAKRDRARTVFAPARLVGSLHRYARLERDELITRVAADYGFRLTEGHVRVRQAGPLSVMFAEGGSTGLGRLGPRDRRALMLVNGDGEPAGPAALWLGTDGQPLAPSTWQSVFRRANSRCARFGLDFRVHPHTLRHSFAVHMLGLLLRQTVAALGDQHAAGSLTSAQVKRLLVGNPLRKLQLLLGHRSEATVYAYLDVLDEAQEIVASALEQWEVQAAAFAQLAAGRGDPDEPGAARPVVPVPRAGASL